MESGGFQRRARRCFSIQDNFAPDKQQKILSLTRCQPRMARRPVDFQKPPTKSRRAALRRDITLSQRRD